MLLSSTGVPGSDKFQCRKSKHTQWCAVHSQLKCFWTQIFTLSTVSLILLIELKGGFHNEASTRIANTQVGPGVLLAPDMTGHSAQANGHICQAASYKGPYKDRDLSGIQSHRVSPSSKVSLFSRELISVDSKDEM